MEDVRGHWLLWSCWNKPLPSPNGDVLLNVHIHEIYDLMDSRGHASRSLPGLFNVVKKLRG